MLRLVRRGKREAGSPKYAASTLDAGQRVGALGSDQTVIGGANVRWQCRFRRFQLAPGPRLFLGVATEVVGLVQQPIPASIWLFWELRCAAPAALVPVSAISILGLPDTVRSHSVDFRRISYVI